MRAQSESEKPYQRWFGIEEPWKRLRGVVEADALRISGDCPRCEDGIDDFVSLSPDWVDELRRNGGFPLIETVTACNCDDTHTGRPERELGCGAIAVLTVELLSVDGRITARVDAAREATVRERSWDAEAARWDHEKAERVSNVAEKWSATIGGLFGLFGFSLVLSDERVARAVASPATWPWWVLGGLIVAAAAACLYGWQQREDEEPADPLLKRTFWGLVGIAILFFAFSATEGRALLDAGPAFGIITGFSVLFGLCATGFAGLAAQGSPKWVNYLTGNRMRRLRMESADRSARNLRRARIATVIAIGSLATALVVLWYAPAADPGVQQVRITTTDGSVVCGRLLPNEGPGIAFDPEGPGQRRVVPRDRLESVAAEDTC